MLLACVRLCVAAGVAALVLLLLLRWPVGPAMTTSAAQDAGATIWTVPEIGALPNDANGRLVRRGRDLITATYAYIGPEVADRAKRFAGNISPAAIAISRLERRSSASRCSDCSGCFPATTPAWGRR
jgi:hypothetical protein